MGIETKTEDLLNSEFGGAEADIKYAAIMWEEQSYSYCTGPGFTIHRYDV